jgi:hypothetical protein
VSEQQGDDTTTESPMGQDPALDGGELPELMASADPRSQEAADRNARRPAPDLDAEALRAAEHALAEGHRALAAARARLAGERPVARRPARRRELILRALLVLNVLAMIAVATLPVPGPTQTGTGTANTPAPSAVSADPRTSERRFNEPWNRALVAADKGDFAQAVTILDQYLASSPRMAPSQQLSVLMALAHYSARQNDWARAQEYQRRADAIERSHSLPEDLVAMAKAAAESGDQESLRRIWARFLLQQRQVPSWLFKHVAEAYLQLGDSYRLQANAAAEAARLEALERTAAALRGREDGK